MIYDINILKTNIADVVGWQTPLLSDYDILDSGVTVSESGLYFEDFHPICQIDNLKNVAPELDDNDFSTWLVRERESAIAKMLITTFQAYKPQVKSIIAYYNMYDLSVNIDDTIGNTGAWVGYRFQLTGNNTRLKINRVLADFDEDDTITLQLFHSSQKAAIKTFDIDTNKNEEIKLDLTDWNLTYNLTNSIGGYWYIGYNQNAISSQAIDRNQKIKHLHHAKIKSVISDSYTGSDIPTDLQDSPYTHGLNFEIIVESDLSQLFIDNRLDFANAIGYQFAYNMLEKALYSSRTNEIERFNKQQLLIELKGTDENKSIGLEYKLNQAIKEINFDLSGLDKINLPVIDKFPFIDL